MPTKKTRRRWRLQRPRNHARRKRRRRHSRPVLRFSPTAWAKLLYLRDAGSTEIGGFGITPADDLLLVEQIALIKQTCTEITVAFDDAAVADYFEEQIDLGRKPEQFARVWIHTHPADSALPSQIDEETFARVFSGCDWAVMLIVARSGAVHAEVYWRSGGGARLPLDVDIDFSRPFAASDQAAWEAEYRACVVEEEAGLPSQTVCWDPSPFNANDREPAATDLAEAGISD